MDLSIATTAGQKHRRLTGGISRADPRDILRVVQNRFYRSARVMNASRLKPISAISLEFAPAHACSDQNRSRAKSRSAIQLQFVESIIARRNLLDRHGRNDLRAKLQHLKNASRRQFSAG